MALLPLKNAINNLIEMKEVRKYQFGFFKHKEVNVQGHCDGV